MKSAKRLKESQGGFTLIEILVVLVILAIMAAITIPSMTGFIDDARKKSATAEARAVYVAAQAAVTESYADGRVPDDIKEQIVRLVGDSRIKEENIGEITLNDGDTQVIRIEYLPSGNKGKIIIDTTDGVIYE